MAINAYNGFYLTPSEIRQIIYTQTDDKSFFNMIPVCRLFYTDLTNEFFEKRCRELFLNNFVDSPFYDPFLKTINCPWKAVLFCSTDPGADRLNHAAEKLACMPLEKFKLYLSNNTIPHFQEYTKPFEMQLETICGKYYQDPDSQIHKAWEVFKKNWSVQDEKDLNESEEKTSREYYDRMFATLKGEELLSFLHVHSVHCIRKYYLDKKYRKASEAYEVIESRRTFHQKEINKYTAITNNYKKIINNPKYLEQYAASIFQLIIVGTSDAIKWKPHLPALRKLNHISIHQKHPFPSNELTPEGAKEAHQLICSLPLEMSSSIWQHLYDQCANGAQEWQWSEKHFHKYAFELDGCTHERIVSIEQRVSNKTDPTKNTTTLYHILMDELEEMPVVGERLSGPNPNQCTQM